MFFLDFLVFLDDCELMIELIFLLDGYFRVVSIWNFFRMFILLLELNLRRKIKEKKKIFERLVENKK